LRDLVFDNLIEKIKTGKSYKSLWRTTQLSFHPDRVASTRFTVEEANELSKYFEIHFPHYTEVE